MSTLRRLTRTVVVLTLVMDFFIFGTLAETMSSYSGQYAVDLEQKQILLESIREDVCKVENKFQENIGNSNVFDKEKTGRLRTGDIDLARIMPQTEKINIAFVCMNGTLSPQRERDHILQGKANPIEYNSAKSED
ncbi:MAG: hypothetical protein KKH77_04965 [Candidatus Omnitrophica bacterium]|nr:hypothetical protein [Candidatus Omnitrophota bacterium]MBU0881269.1 hypothetical protein [Candidatus Omnitrophota bacterium]MBU1038538.1 hypothetical protein [Candidatus Omnitrophota bacterium]MBU1809214.1 hypothetical protein [Candidatus Omnitrophota bacterium]